MLLLTRRPGQAITIRPGKGLDWQTPLGNLFGDGPIEVVVNRINEDEVKIGINAHSDLVILRNELELHKRAADKPLPLAEASKRRDWSSRRILARNVAHYRSSMQLTGQQLADVSGISLTSLIAIEEGMGAVYLEDLDSLARVFEIPVGRLLSH